MKTRTIVDRLYHPKAQIFKVLMHPTRLAILEMLREDEQCVCHMEAVLGMKQAHISQHLMVLREAGLVKDRREGWNIFYRVIKPEIYQVIDAAHLLLGDSSQQVSPLIAGTGQSACPCPKCKADDSLKPREEFSILT